MYTYMHIHAQMYTDIFGTPPIHTYSDDEKDEVILRLLTLLHRSILHGLVQDGGEVGGTIQFHIAHSMLVGIYNTL